MKLVKRGAALCLMILATALPWSAAEAYGKFEKAGRIVAINSTQLTISGQVYRLRSSTRMLSADSMRQKISSLRTGDRVFIKGIVMNGRFYISRLVYQVPEPS